MQVSLRINDIGDIAFNARLSDGTTGLFRKRAGQLVLIGPAIYGFGMNDAGVVGYFKTTTNQIVASDGVTETIIATATTGLGLQPHQTSINNHGVVALVADDGPADQRVLVGDGSFTREVLRAGEVIHGLGTGAERDDRYGSD